MRAVRIDAFGSPRDVLELVDVPEPREPASDEAPLAMEYAPINQTVVCYATAKRDVLVVPALQLIFRDLSIRSFWARRWYQTVSQDRFVAVQQEIVPLVARGAIHVPIAATYPLSAYQEALAHASTGQGRVLFTCS